MDVKEATRTIQSKLDDSGFLDDVTHAELRDINRVFGELSGQDARQVYDQLKADGKLDKWVEEMNSGGWFGTGGLSAGEKTDLFNLLAGKLSGAQLADFSSHLSHEDVVALGKSVASRADASTAVEYVKAMAPQVTAQAGARNDSSVGRASLGVENPAARAVGEVLASMPPAAFGAAINALKGDELNAVMKTAAGMTISTQPDLGIGAAGVPSGVSIDCDPGLLIRILDNAAKSGDPLAQARAFQAASAQLKSMREEIAAPSTYADQSKDLRAVADAMTRLLKSNPSGIVSQFEGGLNRDGIQLVPYTSEMVAQGRGQDLRDIIVGLRNGPGQGDTSPVYAVAPAKDREGNTYFPNAQTLGYFVGAVQVGMDDQAGGAKADGDLLKNIFGATSGAIGAANPLAGVFAATLNGAYVISSDEIAKSVADGNMDAKSALRLMAYPHDSKGNAYNGAAESYYDSAMSRVINANRNN